MGWDDFDSYDVFNDDDPVFGEDYIDYTNRTGVYRADDIEDDLELDEEYDDILDDEVDENVDMYMNSLPSTKTTSTYFPSSTSSSYRRNVPPKKSEEDPLESFYIFVGIIAIIGILIYILYRL